MHFWRTRAGHEVDFILYGERGFLAFEIKRGTRVTPGALKGLRAFIEEYPSAKSYLVYGGTREYYEGAIRIIPIDHFFQLLPTIL